MAKIKIYNFTSESNNLSPYIKLDSSHDNEHEIELEVGNKSENLSNDISAKSCKMKIDEIVIENDIFHVKTYNELAKQNVLQVKNNENPEDHFIIATDLLKENVLEKIKNETYFSLIAGPFKTSPQKKCWNPLRLMGH